MTAPAGPKIGSRRSLAVASERTAGGSGGFVTPEGSIHHSPDPGDRENHHRGPAAPNVARRPGAVEAELVGSPLAFELRRCE